MNTNLTPLEHQMMCSVCTDLRHYKTSLDDARRIRINIDRILPDAPVDTRNITNERLRHTMSENKNVHFMCGYCMKADTNELVNEEKRITDSIIKFLAYVKNNFDTQSEKCTKMYFDIQRNLRGNYPRLAHNLEQYWFTSVKKPEKTKN